MILSNRLPPPPVLVAAPAEIPPPNKLDVCAGCDAVVVGLVFREPKRDGFVDGLGAWRLNIEDIVGRRTL